MSDVVGCDLYEAEIIGEPGVGITIHPNQASPWLSWKETLELHAWLGELITLGAHEMTETAAARPA